MSTAAASTPVSSSYDPFDFVVSSGGGGDYETCPSGSILGALVAIIDLGTHDNDFKGVVTKKRQAAFVFELDEKQANGKPFYIAKQFALPREKMLHGTSALFEFLGLWTGRTLLPSEAGNFAKLFLGKAGIINIKHTAKGDKTYANFASIQPPMRGQSFAPATEPFAYRVVPENPQPIPTQEWLPRIYGQRIEDVIAGCDEFKPKRAPGGNAMTQDELDDDSIPF